MEAVVQSGIHTLLVDIKYNLFDFRLEILESIKYAVNSEKKLLPRKHGASALQLLQCQKGIASHRARKEWSEIYKIVSIQYVERNSTMMGRSYLLLFSVSVKRNMRGNADIFVI
ncbi:MULTISPECIES: hypothetical protein [Acetobacter]|jgi:hypothetical protein|uniref:hypothetical protein n=1 Tax=Acetobacter TaxID=434 RepID=UPI0037703C58